MIALMQCSGGFLAECTNLFMLSTRSSIEYCITFFVAFHVLCAIDNIYAEGISTLELIEAVEKPLLYAANATEMDFWKRGCMNKVQRLVWKVLNFLYNSVYYYYTPFLVNFIPYFFAGNPKDLVH